MRLRPTYCTFDEIKLMLREWAILTQAGAALIAREVALADVIKCVVC